MYGAKADMGDNHSQRIVQPNVALEVWEVSATDSVAGFTLLTSTDQRSLSNESLVSVLQATDVSVQMTQAAILLPHSAVDMAAEIPGKSAIACLNRLHESPTLSYQHSQYQFVVRDLGWCRTHCLSHALTSHIH